MRHTIYSNSDSCIFVLILTRIPHLCLDRTCPQTTHRINRNNNIADWFQRNLAICELVSDIKKQSFKKKLPRTRKEERDGKKEEPWRWNKTQITESHMRARTRTRARTYKNKNQEKWPFADGTRISRYIQRWALPSSSMETTSPDQEPQFLLSSLAWSPMRKARVENGLAVLNWTVLQNGSACSTSSTLPW